MYNIQGKFIIKNLEKFTNIETSKPTNTPTNTPTNKPKIVKAASDAIDNILGEVDTDNHYCVSPNIEQDEKLNKRACKITVDDGIPDDRNINNFVKTWNPNLKKRIIDHKYCDRWSTFINTKIKSDSDCKQLSDDIKEYKNHIKNGCKNKNDYSSLEEKRGLIERLYNVGLWKYGVPENFSELYYCFNNKSERKIDHYGKGCKNDNQCKQQGANDLPLKCYKNQCLDDKLIKENKSIKEGANIALEIVIWSILSVCILCILLCYVLFFKR